MADRKRLAELGTATPLAKELAAQIEAGGAAVVTSVNGATGDVTLGASDVGAVAPGDLSEVATSGAYADLSGTPALAPVATSGDYADLSGTPALSPVATSGAYSDLSGTPSLAFSALPGTVADATGGDLQAILEDLASRIAALEV